jgi:hypothetical protein
MYIGPFQQFYMDLAVGNEWQVKVYLYKAKLRVLSKRE